MNKNKSGFSSRSLSSDSNTDMNASEGWQNSLQEAFLDEIMDVYNAEQQLMKALPKLAEAAQADELRQALEAHLEETAEQVRRLEESMESMDEALKRKKCKAMEGLIAEARDMVGEYEDDPAVDAVLIAAAQKVEHYEIASYGTLCAWARRMGHTRAFDLFQASLREEKAADEKLTHLAESVANPVAHHAS